MLCVVVTVLNCVCGMGHFILFYAYICNVCNLYLLQAEDGGAYKHGGTFLFACLCIAYQVGGHPLQT